MTETIRSARTTNTDRPWLEAMEAWNVQYVVVAKDSDADLLRLLQSQPRWSIDCEDDEAALFSRPAREVGSR